MPNSFDEFGVSIVVPAVTFLMHSTLWLSAAWSVSRWKLFDRPEWSERLWKLAVVLGLCTAAVQLASQWSQPVWQWRIESPSFLIVASNETTPTRDAAEERETFRSRSRETSDRTLTSSATPERVRGPVAKSSSPERSFGEPFVSEADEFEDWKSSIVIAPGETKLTSDAQRIAEEMADSVEQISNLPVKQSPLEGWKPPPRRAVSLRMMAVALMCLLLGGAVRLAWQTWRFARQLRNAMLVNAGTTRQSLDRLLKRSKVRRPVLLLASERIGEPVAFGFWRWTIVVPSGLEAQLSRDELQAALAHEVAHLVRGDVLWLWIGRVLTACFAFQPLHRIAVRHWQHAAECLCDDWAVQQSVSAVTLAKCLTRIAEWRLERRLLTGGLAAVGSSGLLTARVERLLSGKAEAVSTRSRRVRWLISVAASGMSVAVAAWAPCAAWPTQTEGQLSGTALAAGVVQREITAASAVPLSEDALWHALSDELHGLSDDFDQIDALLKQSESDVEVLEASTRLRDNAAEMRERLLKIKASVLANQVQ